MPGVQIGQTEVRSVNGAVDAGPNERRAPLEPKVSVPAAWERATQLNFDVEWESSDQIRVDLGAVIARVRPGRMDVVRDDRLIAAALVGLCGTLGAGLAATRSWRHSRSTPQNRGGRPRLLGAAFLLPLGLLPSAVWLLVLLVLMRLVAPPLELAGAVLSVVIPLAGFWVPLGAIVAFFLWLATKVGRTTRPSNDPGRRPRRLACYRPKHAS
ncbi:hypothetical protein BH24ACT15_BH24ACT15_00890 [soil metagenome]